MHGFPLKTILKTIWGGTGTGGTLLGKVLGHGKAPMTAAKVNYAAGASPTVSNDSTQGYSIGSEWVYGSSYYFCTSAAPGAAVWVLAASGGGSLSGYKGRTAASTTVPVTTISNANVTLTNVIIVTIEAASGQEYPMSITNRVNSTSFDVQLGATAAANTWINWLILS